VWDYGGQRIFTELHHLFLTTYGVYCLLFNMEWLVAEEGSEIHLKCIEYLRFWLSSIAVHTASVDQHDNMSFAPVFLLGTHKDRVPDVAQHEQISKLLCKEFGDMLVWTTVQPNKRGHVASGLGQLCFFAIDNTAGNKDEVVRHVMEDMHALAKDEPYVTNKVPFPWLALLDRMKAQEGSYVRLAEVCDMAKGLGFPTGQDRLEKEVGYVLAFFNQVSHCSRCCMQQLPYSLLHQIKFTCDSYVAANDHS
jgi:hypothetical protein